MALWRSGWLHGLLSIVDRPAEVDTLWAEAPTSTTSTTLHPLEGGRGCRWQTGITVLLLRIRPGADMMTLATDG